jgi:hypothetical protein
MFVQEHMEGLQRAENPTQEYPNLIEIKWKQMEANGSLPPQTPFLRRLLSAPDSYPPNAPICPRLPSAPDSYPPHTPIRLLAPVGSKF